MSKVVVSFRKENCKGCGLCINACPKGLLDFSESTNNAGYPTVYLKEEESCTGCALCAVMCPDVAITVEKEVSA
ncbi:MAG: ferredoxin family protein [Clostridiales bacterium]|nr:ferredoxin family protein [Clostridiales bacterium]MCF8022236.1 ferredoxin family protein [Clostridiales bacterium]